MISPLDLGILAVIGIVIAVALIRAHLRKAAERCRALSMTHAVILKLPLSDDTFGAPEERDRIRQLEDRLEEAILQNQAGEFDGDEFGEGECTIYMYGPDADKLFQAIQPVLQAASLPAPIQVTKRYGSAEDPHSREEHLQL